MVDNAKCRYAIDPSKILHIWLGAKTFRTKPADANGTYLQTENDILGIDWDSNNNNVLTNFKHIGNHPNGTQKTTPILIVSNGAYYFIVPGEMYYNAAISKDKTYAISEGAVHNGGPCAACARVILNNPNLTNRKIVEFHGRVAEREILGAATIESSNSSRRSIEYL